MSDGHERETIRALVEQNAELTRALRKTNRMLFLLLVVVLVPLVAAVISFVLSVVSLSR